MADTQYLDTAEIKRRRQQLTLTMAEAAKRAGFISRQKWNDFENSKGRDPLLSTLLAAASALQCSIADLVNEPFPPRKRKAKT